MFAWRRKLLVIVLAAIPFIVSAALVIDTAVRAERDPLNWLRDQAIWGVCQAAESLRAADAVRVGGAQGVITPEQARARAEDVFAAYYPGQTAFDYSIPLLIQARAASNVRALTYLVIAAFRSPAFATANVTPDAAYGAAALVYLDAVTGSPLTIVTALNITDTDCLDTDFQA